MAEFPGFGEHCSQSACRQLDFLPLKCDACKQTFCKDHLFYTKHECPLAGGRDRQVPVCPLCNQPVPLNDPSQSVDQRVSQHIDNDCPSERAKGQIYKNRCGKKGCKKRELVPVICNDCGRNFCLSHRHGVDHNCAGPTNKPVSSAGGGVFSRFSGNKPRPQPSHAPPAAGVENAHPAHMTEDEALAAALAASLNDTPLAPPNGVPPDGDSLAAQQEQADRELAEQLQRTELQQRQNANRPIPATGRRHSERCDVS